MTFYSYDYVLSQIRQENWVMIGIFIVLLIITGVFVLKGYRDQKDSKYRELTIISVLALVMVVLINLGNYQVDRESNSQAQTSLHFIEVVSKQLGVDKEKIYVNTSAATDGAIVKVGAKFYRAISGSEPDTYLLEKMDLYKADVKLVEVNK